MAEQPEGAQHAPEEFPTADEILEVYRRLGIETQEMRDRFTLHKLPTSVVTYRLVTKFLQNTEPLAREG